MNILIGIIFAIGMRHSVAGNQTIDNHNNDLGSDHYLGVRNTIDVVLLTKTYFLRGRGKSL